MPDANARPDLAEIRRLSRYKSMSIHLHNLACAYLSFSVSIIVLWQYTLRSDAAEKNRVWPLKLFQSWCFIIKFHWNYLSHTKTMHLVVITFHNSEKRERLKQTDRSFCRANRSSGPAKKADCQTLFFYNEMGRNGCKLQPLLLAAGFGL